MTGRHELRADRRRPGALPPGAAFRGGRHARTVGSSGPTSWTEDEDSDVVIDAVLRLEDRVRGWEAAGSGRRFPDLAILVTGDGARRVEFERRFAGLPARRVHLRARWLEPDDYPHVVGSADLGLCLHRSSSGLDIPMKVADLFGAGVPVCALDYGATLAGRSHHGTNGRCSPPRAAGQHLFDLFRGFPRRPPDVERRADARRAAPAVSWDEGWRRGRNLCWPDTSADRPRAADARRRRRPAALHASSWTDCRSSRQHRLRAGRGALVNCRAC